MKIYQIKEFRIMMFEVGDTFESIEYEFEDLPDQYAPEWLEYMECNEWLTANNGILENMQSGSWSGITLETLKDLSLLITEVLECNK